jgi:hypothetical protein
MLRSDVEMVIALLVALAQRTPWATSSGLLHGTQRHDANAVCSGKCSKTYAAIASNLQWQ